ncbi:crystallin J1A [Strongylocentrotus purpuratus]|uniref:Uncharacterized protein n=1 Tax=Strongylocentrotus purpuratus TaxID=7668 RepID=A0A7M7SWD6_STRPU|nr:crystallin J1A [Strongylocentrotus purpuratus]
MFPQRYTRLPVHWVYDQEKLAAEVSKHPTPEFLPEGICPYYKLPTGKNSAYGDHLYVLLKSVVESKGFDVGAYKAGLKAMFGPGSAYDYQRPSGQAEGPYIHGYMKKYLANIAQDKEDTGDTGSTDTDGVINSAVIVALYGGDPQMTSKLEEAVKVVQNTPICIKYALTGAKLLEGLIMNGPNPNAVGDLKGLVDNDVAQEISKAEEMKVHPHNVAAKRLGYACSLPGGFLSMLHCLLNAKPGKFTESIRPTLLAGGDNCSRAAMLGAILGAQMGLEGLPMDLLAKVERGQEVKALAEQLVAMRQS